MRIPCPLCGEREHAEFTVLGDASLRHRPNADGAGVQAAFHEYLHLRDNLAGEHDELWYHEQGGCVLGSSSLGIPRRIA